ncbi:MAG: hypothetical protein JO338_11100 [Aquitalea sp.]|nr:hypothetical protein [Aquitalea sp.]
MAQYCMLKNLAHSIAVIALLLAPALADAQNGMHTLGGGQDKSSHGSIIPGTRPAVAAPPPVGPTIPATEFDCNKPANAMETMLCQDEGLVRLGNRLDKVFTQAMDKARQGSNATQSQGKLQLEQRHWVHALKECMKNDNPHMCLGDTYILRITELQASWELAPSLTPLHYLCGGGVNNDVLATFYRTKPATARLVRAKAQVILHQQELVTGGARYAGQNVELIIRGKEASINWKGENLLCISQPEP